MLTQSWNRYRVFGVTIATQHPFSYPLVATANNPDINFICTSIVPVGVNWLSAALVAQFDYPTSSGTQTYQLYQLADCIVVRFSGVGDYYLWSDKIVCHYCEPLDADRIEIYFLGRVLALWLEQRDQSVIHASAVVVDQRAVAFAANSGHGKSGLASMFVQAGFPLLTDDNLALAVELNPENDSPRILGQSGYPQMRMWPAHAEHFLGSSADLPLVLPTLSKRRVMVGEGGFGRFHPQPAPLAAVYQLQRRLPEKHGDTIEIIPLTTSDALFHLISFSFAARYTSNITDQQKRLKRLLPVARQVPMFKLCYPSGYEYLPTVRQTLLEHINALG